MNRSTYGKVACEPFTDKSVKVETKRATENDDWGVATLANTKTTLVKLKVLFDCRFTVGAVLQYISAEAYVWVRADLYASDYGKQVFTMDNQKFILIPVDRVEVFE